MFVKSEFARLGRRKQIMKQGRPFPEFVSELQRQNQSKRDFLTPMKELKFEAVREFDPIEDTFGDWHPSIAVAGFGHFAPTDHFDSQISTHLGYPLAFYRRSRE